MTPHEHAKRVVEYYMEAKIGDPHQSTDHAVATAVAYLELEQHLAAAKAEIARWQKLMEPQWYWDDRDLESAVPADEVGAYDLIGDIIELRPIVELPKVFALVTENGVEFYDTWDAANESETKGGRDER